MKWFSARTGLYILMALASVVLTGCLEMTTEIHLNSDGSGYVITRHKLVADLSGYSDIENASQEVMAPLEREFIEDYVYLIDGAELSEYRSDFDEDFHTVYVKITFDDTAALSSLLHQQGMQLALFDESSGLDLVLVAGADEPMRDDPLLQDIARTVSMNVSVHTPYPIVSAEPGDAVVDEKSVLYDLPMMEVMTSVEPLTLRLRW